MLRKFISLLVLLITFSCSEKCGEDINVGSFYLTDKTIAEWIPYDESNELKFINQTGDTLILELMNQSSEMQRNDYRTYCDGGEYDYSSDYATEYFMGEYRSFGFGTSYKEINYSISIVASVEAFQGDGNPTELILFDLVSLDLQANRGDGYGEENSNNCFMSYVADNRGNSFNPGEGSYLQIPDFNNDFTLNGNLFDKVLYITNWNDKPTLYFQKEKGVVGFVGLDNETWVLHL